MVVRALHEVRVYIHLLLEQSEAIVDEINENIQRLKEMHERVTRKKRLDYETFDEFMKDLSFFKKNLCQYNIKQNFYSKLKEIHGAFKRLMSENKLIIGLLKCEGKAATKKARENFAFQGKNKRLNDG